MKEHTKILVVLDKSSSMGPVTTDTVSGFNEFLKTQRETPGSADISLYQFGHEYEVSYENRDIQEAPNLSAHRIYGVNPGDGPTTAYSADGWSTSLYDAIGKTIDRAGASLAALPESERPNKVMLVVITDGHENSSREYSHEKVKGMITHQETVYSWETVYLGATPDAVDIATSIGIKGGSAAHYSASKTAQTFSMVGAKMSGYRGMSKEEFTSAPLFTDEDREELS